jgi:rare lipoprotein A
MIAKTAFLAHSLAGALAAAQPAAPVPASPPAPFAADHGAGGRVIESGIATWYGQRGSHHYTANGERFRPTQLTAAHRSLPLGTLVRVTDRSTGRSIVVKVNDREPPHGARCIDLSEGAAKALGIRNQGIAPVTIAMLGAAEPVEVAEAPAPGEQAAATPRATAPQALHRRHTRSRTRR